MVSTHPWSDRLPAGTVPATGGNAGDVAGSIDRHPGPTLGVGPGERVVAAPTSDGGDCMTEPEDPKTQQQRVRRSRELEARASELALALRQPDLKPRRQEGLQEELFRLLFPVLRSYLLSKRMVAEDLDDVLQKAQLKILVKHRQWSGKGPFLAYCYRIAVNEFNLWCRTKRKHRSEVPFAEPEDEGGSFNDPPDPEPTPDLRTQLGELQVRLRDAVRQLPPRRRLCLELYYFQELPYREIADRLNIAIGAVSANINFAKRQLKKDWSLGDLCPWEPPEDSDPKTSHSD